jgi:protein-ribulosamine 3-kinase
MTESQADIFRAEAAGLDALRAAATPFQVPRVVACGSGALGMPFLLLEYLPPGPRKGGLDDTVGWALAALHHHRGPACGFEMPTYCGTTEQPNPWTAAWVGFYAEHRLRMQTRLARDGARLTAAEARQLDVLSGRLHLWLDEPAGGPVLLHGDLWSGNLHVSRSGPALIDPAVYYGHPEADLAMMTLFGGFGPRVFDAYGEAASLAAGWRERQPLYQLYHLLNHLNLFGEAYHAGVMSVASRYA